MSTPDSTPINHLLRAGETVVWSGRPDVRFSAPTAQEMWNTFYPLVLAGVFTWSALVSGAGAIGLVMVGLVLAVVIGHPIYASLRRARTTYYLTDRRAIACVGKAVTAIWLGASPLVQYRSGGRRLTATFGRPPGPPVRWAWAKVPNENELTFHDVGDVDGLVAAIDHVARGTEPQQLRTDWMQYEVDGSALHAAAPPAEPHP